MASLWVFLVRGCMKTFAGFVIENSFKKWSPMLDEGKMARVFHGLAFNLVPLYWLKLAGRKRRLSFCFYPVHDFLSSDPPLSTPRGYTYRKMWLTLTSTYLQLLCVFFFCWLVLFFGTLTFFFYSSCIFSSTQKLVRLLLLLLLLLLFC